MTFRLKYAIVGVMSIALAPGVLAAGNGNAGMGNASFNAVVHSNGVPSAIATEFPTNPVGGVPGNGIGEVVSQIAHDGGGVSVAAIARGDIVPAVPEPDAYLMLLAGLGMVGLIARRRASR